MMDKTERKSLLLCWLPVVLLPCGNLAAAVLSGCALTGSLVWVVGAIAEELVFRLLLLRAVLLPRLKPARAVLLSAALFALLHLFNLRAGAGLTPTLIQIFCAFAFSVWAGAVVCRRDRITIPLLAHILLNATAAADNLWLGFLVSAVVLADGVVLMRSAGK